MEVCYWMTDAWIDQLLPVWSEKFSPHEFLGFGGRGRRGKRFVGVEFKVVDGGVGDGL